MSLQQRVEKNTGLLVLFVILVVSVGGLVEIVPLYFMKSTTEPVTGLKPYSALELSGRDIYIREGCVSCHSPHGSSNDRLLKQPGDGLCRRFSRLRDRPFTGAPIFPLNPDKGLLHGLIF